MKFGSARWMTPAAAVALIVIAGSTAARAQNCAASPSYSPDFTSNQSCLSLLGNGTSSSPTVASFQPGSGSSVLLQITPASSQQRGYAWYTTPQPVDESFSTTFTFQLSGASNPPADGFAFVIQNSPAGANTLGPTGSDGCGLGFGDDPSGNGCVAAAGGIMNSVAVGFKVYNSGPGFPNPDSVFIANNGSGANCVDTGTGGCVIAENDLTSPSITLADGNVHTVTVTYAIQPLSSQTACVSASMPCLDVIVDGTDLFPAGVPFNMTSIGLTNNSAYVGFTGATGGSYENNDILSWVFAPHNFGDVNVCPSGATTPAPCSSTQPVVFNVAAGTTIGSVKVVTQGAYTPPLDFSLASVGTCTGAFSTAGPCTANVTFAPVAPGLRLGAVELFDNNSPANLIATQPIYGIGEGPAIAFGPASQSTVNTQGIALNVPNGVAVDAAGDVFIAEGGNGTNGQVLEVPGNGGPPATVGAELKYPQGLAVDGAGDLFIADNNQNEVVEVTPAGVQTEMDFGLTAQLGVAVDGAGDLFVSDFNTGVVEAPAGCTSNACTSVVYTPATGFYPVGLAVDAAGDLYVAVFTHTPSTAPGQVVKIPAGCTNSLCQTTVGTGWSQPEAVAVDAAGDVFVADELPQVVEVPAGCAQSTCQITISGIYAYGVAVDGAGNVYIPDRSGSAPYSNPDNTNNQVVVVNKSQPPSLSFAATLEGLASADSAVSVQNVGNQTLTGSVAPVSSPFGEDSGSSCDAFSLAPGATCSELFKFMPEATGPFMGMAVFSDNSLNAAPATQSVALSGTGLTNQTSAIPNVVGMTQAAAIATLEGAGFVAGTPGTVSSEYSDSEPAGSVIGEDPGAGGQAYLGTAVALMVSTGTAPAPAPDPLTFENNFFVTGDFAEAGVTLRGTGVGGTATQAINIPDLTTTPGSQGVPEGADIIDGFVYWTTLENTATPSANTGTFLGYPITGQQIGSDVPNYNDGSHTGTLRVYRADVNAYFQVNANWNGARQGSGAFTVTFPDSGGGGDPTGFPTTEGASLVVIYRVLSPNFPLKGIVVFDGSAVPGTSTNLTSQPVQGFYDAHVLGSNAGGVANGGEVAAINYGGGTWNSTPTSVTLTEDASQYPVPLSSGNAYAAVILSTPVKNTDNDGILDAWKAGPPSPDFFAGQPGYYDVRTQSWVALPGATQGEEDLFVQFDYMCSAFLADGVTCDFTKPNQYPSPDANGNDPLAIVTQAFLNSGVLPNTGVHLHLKTGYAVAEGTCTDNTSVSPPQLCVFPSTAAAPQPGVVGWDSTVELSKAWPRNYASCTSGGDCTTRFPYGQKDSYHYVLFGYSLAIPAWNTRSGSLKSITENSSTGQTTIVTADRGTGVNECPSRFTISGVLGFPSLNGVYITASCPDTQIIILTTPGFATSWSYPNLTLPEPDISLTSGTVTSVSGFSDLGGSDSAVTLGLWATDSNQDMSKSVPVIAGTLFHEIGHTLGLSHGGLYFDTPGSYIPTYDVNCKPNYQSVMNYLFQVDGLGQNGTVAYSGQTLETLSESSLASVPSLTGAAYPTSAWYTNVAPSPTTSPATLHCDGTPLNTGETGYRVNGSIAPVTPPWSELVDPNITFDGVPYTNLLGYDDISNLDLRQVGAAGGEFASLANALTYGSGGVGYGGSGGVGFGGSGGVGFGGSGGVGFGGSGGVGFGGSGGVGFGGSGGVGFGGSGGVGFAGSGGVGFGGSGGVSFEVGYDDANSIVRPPPLATYSVTPTNSVLVNWLAPAFGVVQTYTISREVVDSHGNVLEPTVVIGSVSGVNGYAPATTFTDTSAPTEGTLVYTIATTLVMDPDGSQRSSAPSPPAVVALNQTIVLGSVLVPFPSSVLISNSPVTVTATAETNGVANGLQVSFSTSGPCSIGTQSIMNGVSSANVNLSGTGICTIKASQAGNASNSQPGTTDYNAASPVQGSFTILPEGSNTKSQTITFGALANVVYGIVPFTVSATSATSPVSFSTPANGPCTVNATTVSITGAGVCKITASAPSGSVGNTNYSAASVTQSFTVYPAPLTVTATNLTATYGQTLPALTCSYSGFVNGDQQTASPCGTAATSGPVTGTPALATTAASTSSVGPPNPYPITVSTGSLAAANYSFLYVNGNVIIQQASQAITFTQKAPSSAAYNSSFTVIAAGGASGIPVAFSSSGPCTITGTGSNSATYTINNSTGTCSVIASQGGNTNYSAAQPVTELVNANGPALTVNPTIISFGTVNLGSVTTKNITLTNAGTSPVTINGPILSIVQGGNSNEFVAANLCPSSLAVGNSCTITIAFVAGPFYTLQTAALEIMDSAPGSPQQVTLSATVLQPQTITFSTPPPPSSAYNSSFTVAATASSGLTVSYGSSGSCTNSGTKYTMTSGTGTCSVIANQAGNSTYAAATQVTKSVSATLATPTISISNLPTNAVYGGSYMAAYSYTGNGMPSVSSSTTSVCKATGSSVSFVGVGTCTLKASATATTNYAAVTGSAQSFTVGQATQTITLTNVPSSAAYKSSFAVAATGGASGNAVTFTSSGSCSNSGATYTMTSSTGTCSVIANQAGNSDYSAAPKVTEGVTATLAAQTITFTTNPPATAAYKTSFKVAATGGASGNAVTFTSSGSCSNSGATYTMTSGTGTCSVIANQGGNSNYTAAAPVTKTVSATLVAQTITFTTNPPATAALNSSFTVAAMGGGSGNAVIFTSSGACTNTGGTYKMTSGTGTCSVIANQAGNSNYAAAAQVTKTVTAKQ